MTKDKYKTNTYNYSELDTVPMSLMTFLSTTQAGSEEGFRPEKSE